MTTKMFLDLGTNTGYVIYDGINYLDFGRQVNTVNTIQQKDWYTRADFETWIVFENFLKEKCEKFNIVQIVFERVKFAQISHRARRYYNGLVAILEKHVWVYNIDLIHISPTELKKKFTGNAKAKKSAIVQKVNQLDFFKDRKKLLVSKDHDIADAFAISRIVYANNI